MYERNITGQGIKQPEQQQRGHSLIIVNDPGGAWSSCTFIRTMCASVSEQLFDIEKYLSTKLVLKADEVCEVFDAGRV